MHLLFVYLRLYAWKEALAQLVNVRGKRNYKIGVSKSGRPTPMVEYLINRKSTNIIQFVLEILILEYLNINWNSRHNFLKNG